VSTWYFFHWLDDDEESLEIEIVCTVRAPTWFDARTIAMRVSGCGPDELAFAETSREPSHQCRWVGTDAGRVAGRRMEVRVRDARGRWKRWVQA